MREEVVRMLLFIYDSMSSNVAAWLDIKPERDVLAKLTVSPTLPPTMYIASSTRISELTPLFLRGVP